MEGPHVLAIVCLHRHSCLFGCSKTNGNIAVPSFHAGNPIDPNQILGCGLAIAYKSNANDVRQEDFAVFSINTNCVRDLKTVFQVPAKMPACPNGKCTCAWFWQGQSSANEMVPHPTLI